MLRYDLLIILKANPEGTFRTLIDTEETVKLMFSLTLIDRHSGAQNYQETVEPLHGSNLVWEFRLTMRATRTSKLLRVNRTRWQHNAM